MSKIGIGVITCNRPEFCRNLLNSLPQNYETVVINDGDELPYDIPVGACIKNEANFGVGKSKNRALRYLLHKNCDYIFLIEDDLIIKDHNVFDIYVKHMQVSGLQHLMYGYHGPANKKNGKPAPRVVVEYKDNVQIALNLHCVGAFCVYTKKLLDDIGLFDETYLNAWEHVDHSYLAVKKGYLPGYWWWPDVHESWRYIDEQACSEVNSSIRPRKDWQENIRNGAKHFESKHNVLPWTVESIVEQRVYNNLKLIQQKHK